MLYEDAAHMFENFMVKHCGYLIDYQVNHCYRKYIFNENTGEIIYSIKCALVNDLTNADINVIFEINKKLLKLPLNVDTLYDKNEFIKFIWNIKEKYLKDYEYLLKCAIESERKNKMEKDFV